MNVFRGNVLLFAFAAMLAALTVPPGIASAAQTFACNRSGGAQAIIDACGARWSAANIRAHIAARTYGGSSVACLTKTAVALEALAAKWIARGRSDESYKLPCGALPAVASADDGALAQVCPSAVWSYDNRGQSGCNASIPAHAASFTARHDDAPSYDETARWLASNVPLLSHGNNGAEATNTIGFTISDCIVTWQIHRETSSSEDVSATIPFSMVTSINSKPDYLEDHFGAGGPRVAIEMSGDRIHLVHTGADGGITMDTYWHKFAADVAAQADADRIERALTRLATLCRSKNSTF